MNSAIARHSAANLLNFSVQFIEPSSLCRTLSHPTCALHFGGWDHCTHWNGSPGTPQIACHAQLQPCAHHPGAGPSRATDHPIRISLLRCRSSSSFDCPAAMALASDLTRPKFYPSTAHLDKKSPKSRGLAIHHDALRSHKIPAVRSIQLVSKKRPCLSSRRDSTDTRSYRKSAR